MLLLVFFNLDVVALVRNPSRRSSVLNYVNVYNNLYYYCEKLLCMVVVIDCDRNQLGAGLKLGEDFGWDIRKTAETLSEFWLEVQTLFMAK